jgi:hypothetical protein
MGEKTFLQHRCRARGLLWQSGQRFPASVERPWIAQCSIKQSAKEFFHIVSASARENKTAFQSPVHMPFSRLHNDTPFLDKKGSTKLHENKCDVNHECTRMFENQDTARAYCGGAWHSHKTCRSACHNLWNHAPASAVRGLMQTLFLIIWVFKLSRIRPG